MSTIAPLTSTLPDGRAGLAQFVEAGPRRTASRAEIRALLADFLRRDSNVVENFSATGFGIEPIRIGDPELILLDLEHPDRSGPQVLQAIQSDPAARFLPVVMLAGEAATLGKVPFAAETLVPRVRALVRLKPTADERDEAGRMIMTLARAMDARGGDWSASTASRFE